MDLITQSIGSFIHEGDGRAVSPVFASAVELYGWMSREGWQCVEPDEELTADLDPSDFKVVYVGMPPGVSLS